MATQQWFSRGLTLAALACVFMRPPRAPGAELDARRWFNNPVFRLHDDRTVVLFFFHTDDKAADIVPRLNRLSQRPEHVVIGLTPDACGKARQFIERHKVRFTVGCASRSAAAFGIDRLPALVRIDRARGGAPEVLAPTDLERIAAQCEKSGEAPPLLPEDPEELMAFIVAGCKGPEPGSTVDPEEAIRRLFELADRETFDRFAAEQIPREADPWARGLLRYLSSLPADAELPERYPLAPSVTYENEMARDPQAPTWAPVRAFREALERENPPPEALLQRYREHAGDDPVNLLIRRSITLRLHHAQDRQSAKAALLEIAGSDPDHSIRFLAVFGLYLICEPGDAEVADYLEALAASEPHVLNVRPTMEHVSQVLRAGRGPGPRP